MNKIMAIILGLFLIVLGCIFIYSPFRDKAEKAKEASRIKIGDVFGMTNPGSSQTGPNEKPRPFVGIYRVKDIQGEKALLEIKYASFDRPTPQGEYEYWDDLKDLGEFDDKLN